jgi:hypothetical protein
LEKTIVVIPTAKRPELLAQTLQYLESASGKPEVHIYADSVNETILREIEYVRNTRLPEAFLFHAKPHQQAASGCWNILNSIKHGARFAENVYIIEEDIWIYGDRFFQWHESQSAVASCGRYHYDKRWVYRHLYTNPGSLLRRPLLDALVPHINDDYFSDTKAYCDAHFPPWDVSTLDDWLIRRVMREHDWLPAYPERPVCAHVGFRGYNSLDIYQNKEGSLEQRIERARQLIADPPQREMWARDWEPYQP